LTALWRNWIAVPKGSRIGFILKWIRHQHRDRYAALGQEDGNALGMVCLSHDMLFFFLFSIIHEKSYLIGEDD
jgi:hypothetical protein